MKKFYNPVADLPYLTPQLAWQLAEIPGQMVKHLIKIPVTPAPRRISYGNHRRQYMLVWNHPEPEGNRVIFFVHGGAWRNGFPGMYPDVAHFFLEQGFSVVMPAYRLAPRYSHPQMMEDMVLAFNRTISLFDNNGNGQSRIVISGSSAGATLSAHLAFDRRHWEKIQADREMVSGFMSLAGPLNLNALQPFQAVLWYAGGAPGTQAFEEANPINHLRHDESTPSLLMHCPDDAIVPFESSQTFAEQYPEPNAVELWEINGHTHLDSMRFAQDNERMAAKIIGWLSDK